MLVVSGDARALLARRAHGAELPRPPLGRRDDGRARGRARCRRAPARGCSTRARRRPGCARSRRRPSRAGGAVNHRAGLYDAILIKENHIAAAGGIARGRRAWRARPRPSWRHARGRGAQRRRRSTQALAAGAPRLLLDNMDVAELRAAVAQVAGRAELEASGGVTLADAPGGRSTGVDIVSMGALTHSAPALDLSLILEPLP